MCMMPNCWQPSEHADHYPRSLKDLQALGLNPYHARYGRGLCASHHSEATAQHQPGGWHAQ